MMPVRRKPGCYDDGHNLRLGPRTEARPRSTETQEDPSRCTTRKKICSRPSRRSKLSRRELMERAGKLGIGAAAAPTSCSAPPRPRPWPPTSTGRSSRARSSSCCSNKHPYADAMIADLDNFKTMTGMDVTYDIFPEDVYFDKVTAALSSKSDQYDAFMTGAYMTWTYGPAGWIEDLNALDQGPGQDQSELQLGRRAAGPARLDRLERRARRRARLGRRQAMVHPVGLRAQLDHLQPEDVRQGRRRSRPTTCPS